MIGFTPMRLECTRCGETYWDGRPVETLERRDLAWSHHWTHNSFRIRFDGNRFLVDFLGWEYDG